MENYRESEETYKEALDCYRANISRAAIANSDRSYFLRDNPGSWAEESRRVLWHYVKGQGHYSINGNLWQICGGDPFETLSPDAEILLLAMLEHSCHISKDIKVWRSFSFTGSAMSRIPHLGIGESIDYYGFISTSLNNLRSRNSGLIQVKANTPYIHWVGGEAEILLLPGTLTKVADLAGTLGIFDYEVKICPTVLKMLMDAKATKALV
jgi:hypothetical protein